MNSRLFVTGLIFGGSLLASAQPAPPKEPPTEEMSEEVRAAIEKFKTSRHDVVDPPPVKPAAESGADKGSPAEAAKKPVETPPPAEPAKPAEAKDRQEGGQSAVTMADPIDPEQGLTVKVEKLQTGNGVIDPKSVTLRSPFPAKPLSQSPKGWHLETPPSSPPFLKTVELSPGSSITLNIRPHVLVPDSDGANRFAITEPGFDPDLGYGQTQTLGAVLSSSVQKLDEDAKQLGNTIDLLQQLLSSLPQPVPVAVPVQEPDLLIEKIKGKSKPAHPRIK